MNKKMVFGLTGFLIVIFGILGSFFYVYCEDVNVRNKKLQDELTDALQQIAVLKEEQKDLLAEKEVLLEEAEYVTVMGKDGSVVRYPKLNFKVDLNDWKYLLVNELHPLKRDFEVELAFTRNGQKVDARIKESLEAMLDAGRKEGVNMMVCSSFRTYEKQTRLMENAIKKYMKQGLDYREAFFKAKERTALTGYSEHHTGLAVDIVSSSHQSLDRAQANTKEAKWLKEHAHEYGFVLRYPADKEEQTMILFESWHYRYVGKEAAAYMKENNLCLEEFLELAELLQTNKKDQQVRK